MLSIADSSYSRSVVLKCLWFKKKKAKNQHQTEHSKYILCNVYIIFSSLGLHHPLSFFSVLWTRAPGEDSRFILRSKLSYLSPLNRWEKSRGPIQWPLGLENCPPLEVGREEYFLPATQAVLSLTLKQPPLLPPTPHHGPLAPLSQSEHRIDKREGALLLRPDHWKWRYWAKDSGPVSSWVAYLLNSCSFPNHAEMPPVPHTDSLYRFGSISGISLLFPYLGVSFWHQPYSSNYCCFI